MKSDELESSGFLLTPLGKNLALLPCAPKVGRLLIYGTLLGCTGKRCILFLIIFLTIIIFA